MKTFIATIIMLTFVSTTFAEEACVEQVGQEQTTGQEVINTDVPNFLKGAMITVTLADGKTSTVSAEKFKVVPRKQQFITTRTEKTKVISCTTPSNYKNRVSVLGGHGAKGGLDTNSSNYPNEVDVSSKTGFVAGLQYQRALPFISDRLNIGVQGQTNKTFSGMLGLDF